ncbi:MAG: type II toxin-antitoxin system VapC family toxin [Candidatus Njordarchaeia archaeon]
MRFIDSNIFIHAWIKPKRKLNEKEMTIKENSKKILQRVEKGEKVVTSVIHLSEIANLLESRMRLDKSLIYIEAIIGNRNIEIMEVDKNDLIESLEIAREYMIGLVDAVAVTIMEKLGIKEIYTQDKDIRRADVIPIKE